MRESASALSERGMEMPRRPPHWRIPRRIRHRHAPRNPSVVRITQTGPTVDSRSNVPSDALEIRCRPADVPDPLVALVAARFPESESQGLDARNLASLWYIYPDARRCDVQRAVKSHPNESTAPTHRAFQRLERKGQIKDAPRLRENARRENRRVRITSRGIAQLEILETERGLDARSDIRAHVIKLQGSKP